jgi:hypothetical protein
MKAKGGPFRGWSVGGGQGIKESDGDGWST